MYLNKRQEKRRADAGQVGRKQDASLMTLQQAEKYKETMQADASARGETVNANAFSDLTDLKNIDFMYVI